LNGVAPFDWAKFLRDRIDAHAPPLDGVAASGWKLIYTDKPSEYQKTAESDAKAIDYAASIGLTVSTKDGKLTDVKWNGPAFKAGIGSGGTLVAINGREFSAERLKDAVAATAKGEPLDLLIKSGEMYRTFRIEYREGLKYPHLERIGGVPDRLTAILTARK
jgi:predicted metalloprotease with PDZ domain